MWLKWKMKVDKPKKYACYKHGESEARLVIRTKKEVHTLCVECILDLLEKNGIKSMEEI